MVGACRYDGPMPWHVTSNDSACPAAQPWSVRVDATDELVGCHPSREEALDQIAALHIAGAVSDLLGYRTLDDLDLTPTAGMRAEAERGLAWRDEFNRGGTAVGIARARDIVNARRLSPDTVIRMNSFFARHEVDKRAAGFRPGGDGYPSNGRIAWALWGGDPGQTWSRKMARQIQAIRAENS